MPNKAFPLRVTSLSPHQTGEACVTPTLDEEVPLTHLGKTVFSGREKGLRYANPTPSVHTGTPELHNPGLLSQQSAWDLSSL